MKVNYVFLSIFLMFNSCIPQKVGNKDVKTNNSMKQVSEEIFLVKNIQNLRSYIRKVID